MNYRRFRWPARLTLVAVGLFQVTSLWANPSVTLGWNASPDPSVVGYQVYDGRSSQIYTNIINVGSKTSVTVSNLAVGGTYYFAVTAYDVLGLESLFSNELSYTVPSGTVAPRLQVQLLPGRLLRLSAAGLVGQTYQVQSSQNLTNWSLLGSVTVTNGGGILFTDPSPATNRVRYYRLH